MPATVVDATVKLSVELPAPVIDVGLNPTVTPAGIPAALRAIAESKPPETALVIVVDPELPCAMLTVPGDAERL